MAHLIRLEKLYHIRQQKKLTFLFLTILTDEKDLS